ncbi:proline-rich protein HaeIII subfamily 1-like [Ooceraea biroi]|uniref:proline-rich protein HaeIII subfamily 1-like n=1 Tax=Ooceraea biroi TaxID=2015173 RepID=UPI000F077293|nr:proline-rich protein HaeIII subfamily 1-like [Ooceraea biroi]
MSQQHPSRPPGGHGPPGGWSGRANASAPSPFRPASPYTPSSSPHPQGRALRGPPTPVHPAARPMSPLTYPGIMMHPMSPVPIGMPISPGMSPVFGCPTSGYIQCPRPRWPSPIPTSSPAPRPFIPLQVLISASAKNDKH